MVYIAPKTNTMKILFVINDSPSAYLEYEHTGVMAAPHRRAVEIDLTEEQVQKLGIRKLGMNCGNPISEVIESVSISSHEQHR